MLTDDMKNELCAIASYTSRALAQMMCKGAERGALLTYFDIVLNTELRAANSALTSHAYTDEQFECDRAALESICSANETGA